MKRISLTLLAAVLLLMLPVCASAEEAVPIHTPQELASIGDDPSGSYILMNDLDMAGIPWKSLDFSGTLDGNGHAILNLELSEPSERSPESMDGNNKTYQTSYVGLFGTLEEAEIRNLKLVNVRGLVESDTPVFLAALAGYSRDSRIRDCEISATLELRAWDRIYGVAGVIGYGSGWVENCKVEATLICTDTDEDSACEQFLGGVFAAGFVDVTDSEITIRGYCSEHGYVHNGGIGGLYMQYPLAMQRAGYITGNRVSGIITFFEDSPSRRAYCEAYCGEILAHNYHIRENTQDFLRDERMEYDVELRPEMCPEPRYTEIVRLSGCTEGSYGYIEYTCTGCGYSYRDSYTLLSHQVSSWKAVKEATAEEEGTSVGRCDSCGEEQLRTEAKLPEVITEPEPTAVQETALVEEENLPVGAGLLGIAGILLLGTLVLKKPRKQGRYSR